MSNITPIRKIETITKIDHYQGYLDDMPCAGYKITTDQQEIMLVIDSDQQCCESWGYLMSEDDLNKFVKAALLGLRIIDTDSTTVKEIKPEEKWTDEDYRDDDEDQPCETDRFEHTMFINIETDRGDSPIHCVQQSQWLLRAYGPGSQSATDLSENAIRGVKYAHLKLLRLPR